MTLTETTNVVEIDALELREHLEAGRATAFFDVRTPYERELASIVGARLLDQETVQYIETLDRDTPLYFHCHHGMRSRAAAEHFRELGFKELYNLSGGIEAWSRLVDPSVPRY